MTIYTADMISTILREAETFDAINWNKLRAVATEVYHEACFQRYAKKSVGTHESTDPFTGIHDDPVTLVRTVYVDGCAIYKVTAEALESITNTLPRCLVAWFGTFIKPHVVDLTP